MISESNKLKILENYEKTIELKHKSGNYKVIIHVKNNKLEIVDKQGQTIKEYTLKEQSKVMRSDLLRLLQLIGFE
ncbi:MAG: hypothetical protein QW228_08955 [Candidatus Aenigmatarchaeota archaeon]